MSGTTAILTTCPIDGEPLQATRTVWMHRVTATVQNGLVLYEDGEEWGEEESSVYCRNDHTAEQMQNQLALNANKVKA